MMRQTIIITACYTLAAACLVCSILCRLVWQNSFWLKFSVCLFGLTLLIGTCLLFGRKK